ncbi:cortical protein marker for cell polarity-domain-containing protein [Radiomyces spectabilis]|uniref:cortical protein marker for cell polarity-domain-containing protein n=1 Tax=Radiomyces spectabilis TaxID=64574 RepID=UPI00221E72CC|nr:cortical protein marker for cell polarity-domain-containing protein [Radiomyces spectabilis]KAI8381043.1 cortical protein marker for cell polarity-domain-containing protein [Radiomyces spectabilis]
MNCHRRHAAWQRWLFTILTLLPLSQADSFKEPLLNFDTIGQLGFVGDYAGISPFTDTNQSASFNTTYSNIVLQQHGIYTLFATTNGDVHTTCQLVDDVFIGGSFTAVNNTIVNHIARYDAASHTFVSLQQGLDGPVHSVYCDETNHAVYVGGEFRAPIGIDNTTAQNFTGSVGLWQNNRWVNLPWQGFNGPVYTITRNPAQDTILFGGRFEATGDGFYYNTNSSQPVNLDASATVSSGNGAMNGDFTDPRNVICQNNSGASSSADQPWLLQDGVPGYWEAQFAYPIEPSMFRIANTHLPDRGTKTFGILALGSNEYFQLSYVDPITQQLMTCTQSCPLSENPQLVSEEFTVTKTMATQGIRIMIDAWYGAGGGLGGVEIFQSDIALHAHNSNGNSSCNSAAASRTDVTGQWEDKFAYGAYQNFLTSTFPATQLASNTASIRYTPYVPVQGNYAVYAKTPGCVGTSSCNQRTQIEFTMEMTPGNTTTMILDQAVYEDTKTLIYTGLVAASSEAFRPSLTLKVAPNATPPASGTVSLVANSIEFIRNGTGATLVSILEYSPHNLTMNISPAWRPLADQLMVGSVVNTIDASRGNEIYLGGRFFNPNGTFRNIAAFNYDRSLILPLNDGGLNSNVTDIRVMGSNVYVGGQFNGTVTGTQTGIKYAAAYDLTSNTWSGLEGGLDGPVTHMMVSADQRQLTLAGTFSHALWSDQRVATGPTGNAIWDLSRRQWTERDSLIVGEIVAMHGILNNRTMIVGRIQGAQTFRTNGISLTDGQKQWQPLISNDRDDVLINAGVFWHNSSHPNNQTVTIIGGKFQTDNLTNLAMYYDDAWHELGRLEGEIYSLAVLKNYLYIGGQFNGTLGTSQPKSFAIYDLATRTSVDVSGIYGADGKPGRVNVITLRSDGKALFIGGNFSLAGSLACAAVCTLDTNTRQWNMVAQGMTGHVRDLTISGGQMTAVGALTVNDQPTYIAKLPDQAATWISYWPQTTATFGVPTTVLGGPNQAVIVAGSNASMGYLGSWDGQQFTDLGSNFGTATDISQLMYVPITKSPSDQRYPANTDDVLMAIGKLMIPPYGNVSAAFYDGSSWYPYILTTRLNGTAGQIHHIFHGSSCCSVGDIRHYLPVPAVILISIAISLGIIFVLVGLGLIVLFIRRRNGVDDYPEPLQPWKQGMQRSSLMEMLDAAPLGGALAGAGVGAAASASREKQKAASNEMDLSDKRLNRMGPAAAEKNAGVSSFGAMMAAALTQGNDGVASEKSPHLYYAKHPFEAKEYGELDLKAGDAIVVTDTSDNVWWMGYKDDGSGNPISGLFPSNYVRSPSHP